MRQIYFQDNWRQTEAWEGPLVTLKARYEQRYKYANSKGYEIKGQEHIEEVLNYAKSKFFTVF